MNTFSFVAARSNSGKTTLIEKIVKLLKARGLRVAVVKHASKGFDVDLPGKDSWRFQQAGADTVMLIGAGRMATFAVIDREPDLDELERSLSADVVIVEGFKETARNRIEVFRAGISGERPLCMDGQGFLALVSDRKFPVAVPFFDLDDAEGIVQFMLKNMHAQR